MVISLPTSKELCPASQLRKNVVVSQISNQLSREEKKKVEIENSSRLYLSIRHYTRDFNNIFYKSTKKEECTRKKIHRGRNSGY